MLKRNDAFTNPTFIILDAKAEKKIDIHLQLSSAKGKVPFLKTTSTCIKIKNKIKKKNQFTNYTFIDEARCLLPPSTTAP